MSHGLSFLASYTWSHSLDIASSGQSAGSIETWYDLAREYSNSDFDMPNIFVFSYTYELPFGRGQWLGSGWNRGVNAVLGGWQISGITSAHSGVPFTVTVPFDNANVGGGEQRAQQVGNPLPSGFTQTRTQWYNKAAYAVPAPFTFGNLGQNALRGPGYFDFDFSLNKQFNFTESKSLEVRGDFFNTFNNVHFGNPVNAVTNPNFMTILGAGAAREIQLSAKFIF